MNTAKVRKYNLANLKDQFTLKNLKKHYSNLNDELIGLRLVVRVVDIQKVTNIQKKEYMVFILSDDVNRVPALLYTSTASLGRQELLEQCFKQHEPVIIENPKKTLITPSMPFAIEISTKIPPIGTTIEPISSYNQKELNYFFEPERIKKKTADSLKTLASPFVTASDLLKVDQKIQISTPSEEPHIASSEEMIAYFANNSSKWTLNLSLDKKKLQNTQDSKISYIIQFLDQSKNNFSSKCKFIAMNETDKSWYTIFDITVQDKEFYQLIKKNIDLICSIQTLQSLIEIEV